jgi:hypothetical protein
MLQMSQALPSDVLQGWKRDDDLLRVGSNIQGYRDS